LRRRVLHRGFDPNAWQRGQDARFESPHHSPALGKEFWEKWERDQWIPPMYRHRLLYYDPEKMRQDREREAAEHAKNKKKGKHPIFGGLPAGAFASEATLVKALEDSYGVPHGTLDLYPKVKDACIDLEAMALAELKAEAEEAAAKENAKLDDGESEQSSSSEVSVSFLSILHL
jgi:hypothetical protein